MLEKLKKLYNKRVKVITTNKKLIIGVFCIFQRLEDNEEKVNSIIIETKKGLFEVLETEIQSIEEEIIK